MSGNPSLANVRRLIAQQNYPDAARECLDFLRAEPKHVEANLLYGELALLMQRDHDAIVIFRKLLSVAPRHPIAHDRLAYLYNLTGDVANAKRHAEVALSEDDGAIESRLALGIAAMQEGEKERALAFFNAARERAPGNLNVEMAYADALQQLGEFEQARELLNELIRQHPDNSFLYNALARTRKFTQDDPEVELIRSLVDAQGQVTKTGSAEGRHVAAYMALHKIESDLGNDNTAFDFLERGKGIRRSHNPHQQHHIDKMHEDMRSVFSAEFFSRHASRKLGADDTAPIFIACMPRSGSTLLERVMGSSPEISNAGELPLVINLVQELAAKFGKNQHDMAGLAKVPDDVWAQAGMEYMRRARSRVGDTPFFTDKMPGNFAAIGFIRAALPRARIIHLTRHPVANCFSIYETDFTTGHPYANDPQWLGEYYVSYRRCMDHWLGLFPGDMLEVSYEDLVGNTSDTIAKLQDYLQLELDPASVGTSQQAGHIMTASQWQARQPIHTGSIERWKRVEHRLQALLEALSPVLSAGA